MEKRGHEGIADNEDVVDGQARRGVDEEVGARLVVTGDVDGRTIGQIEGAFVGTVWSGSIHPSQAIGPAHEVAATGFRGFQHVDDVVTAWIATWFPRSEERLVGTGCVIKFRSRLTAYYLRKTSLVY